MKKLFFAFDPGLTTGYAVYDARDGSFHSGQIEGRFAFYHQFYTYFSPRLDVVGERFIITSETAKKSRQPDPLYIIGHVEAVCQERQCPFSLQSPAEGKAFGTDAKLKVLGWWNPTKGGHANDAARHLITRLAKAPDQISPEMMDKLLELL